MGRPLGGKNRTLEEKARALAAEQKQLKLQQKLAAKNAEIEALKQKLAKK